MRLALALAAVVVGCGGGDEGPKDAPVAADAPCSLIGSFGAGRNDAGFRNGIEFRGDGFFVITRSVGAMVTGTYAVSSGLTVTFTDQIGDPPGLTCPSPGSYSYSWSSDCRTISFLVSSDSCLARTSILSNASFTRD